MKKAWSKINKITFFFLSFFLIILFLTMFLSTKQAWQFIVLIMGVAILILGLTEEKKKLKHERYTLAREIEVLIAVPIASSLTFLVGTQIDFGYGLLGPVIAAGFIGLIGSFLKKEKLANPIYCGAFIGMSSIVVFPHFLPVGLAGLIAGFVFIFSHEVYNQTGGTLGTIAFSGVNITKKLILGLIGAL